MAIGGAFLGGGVEVVPAGSCKLELEILTEDRANLTAMFTIKGTSTYTVTAGADGRAVYTVPAGQTYTVSVNTTGYDNLASQTVIAESGTVRYVRFEAFSGRVKRSGDTMTGTLAVVGGASIDTNGQVIGKKLRATADIHLGSSPSSYAVINDGWIQNRTIDETKSDLGITSKQDNLTAGTNITIINNTISAKDTTYDVATQSANGLMSSADKTKLDGIESGAQKNTITGVKGSTESTYRTGNVSISPADIGLSNVNNTSDADKPISTAVQNALNGKQATMSAGTGISLNGATINHSNSVTAQTSYVGSATSVPMIKYDAQGHITATSSATIYPPTTVGTSGQYWKSDGAGVGTWQTPDATPTSGSGNAITSGAVYNITNYTRHFTYVAGATNVAVSGKTVSFYGVNFTYIRTGPKCGVLSGMYRVGSEKGTYIGFAYIDLAWLGTKFGVSFKKPSSSYYSGTWYYPDGGSSMYDKVQYCHVVTENSGAICIGRIYGTSSFGDWNWADHDAGNWISIEGVFLEEE